jgi:hypothetical protein
MNPNFSHFQFPSLDRWSFEDAQRLLSSKLHIFYLNESFNVLDIKKVPVFLYTPSFRNQYISLYKTLNHRTRIDYSKVV